MMTGTKNDYDQGKQGAIWVGVTYMESEWHAQQPQHRWQLSWIAKSTADTIRPAGDIWRPSRVTFDVNRGWHLTSITGDVWRQLRVTFDVNCGWRLTSRMMRKRVGRVPFLFCEIPHRFPITNLGKAKEAWRGIRRAFFMIKTKREKRRKKCERELRQMEYSLERKSPP